MLAAMRGPRSVLVLVTVVQQELLVITCSELDLWYRLVSHRHRPWDREQSAITWCTHSAILCFSIS